MAVNHHQLIRRKETDLIEAWKHRRVQIIQHMSLSFSQYNIQPDSTCRTHTDISVDKTYRYRCAIKYRTKSTCTSSVELYRWLLKAKTVIFILKSKC